MKILFSRITSLFVALLLLAAPAFSHVTLPSILGNNMVLQRNSTVKLWGSAKKSTTVKVVTSWNNATHTTRSGADGKWEISVPTGNAGGPYTISFSDGEETKLENILLGEVWLCSGQSNMEMPLRGNKNQPVTNSNAILLKSNNSKLRLFKVERALSTKEEEDCKGSWAVSDPASAREFSAVAYQYGLMLQEYLQVPVGMVASSWGGTPIKAWMNEETVRSFPEIKTNEGEPDSKSPFVLYNAMIHPLNKMQFKGFLWYQGESDKGHPDLYHRMMIAMVNQWRKDHGNEKLPFYFVQIAPWPYPQEGTDFQAAQLREAQQKALNDIPFSGMAVTMDVGSNVSIHPPDKTPVAQRLLYWALANDYGAKGISFRSPEFNKLTINKDKAQISFDHAPLGLMLSGDTLSCFQIAGADKKFYPAQARINANGILVFSESVKEPVAVRYAFKNYVNGCLFSVEGLPVAPFRTDNWNR